MTTKKTVVIRFIALPFNQRELNQIEPLSPEEQTTIISRLGITQNPGETPAAAWVRSMHNENNLPYIPDMIHPKIVSEIESNENVQKFVKLIGLEMFEEELPEEQPND